MNKKNEIRGIVFDLGGVLVRSFEFNFYKVAGRKIGLSPSTIAKIAESEWATLEVGKETNSELWHRIAKKLGNPGLGNVLASLWLRHYKRDAKIKKAVLEIVKRLHHKYKMGVISNTQREHSIVDRKRGLFKHFDVVLLSNEIGLRKPQHEIFALASEKLRVPPQNLLFIDDDSRWTTTAKRYGWKALRFISARQLKKSLKRLGIRTNRRSKS